MRTLWAILLRVLGACLALLSCIPMVAMLPAGFVAVMGLVGLTAAPVIAWAAPLAPIAPYLFIVSTVLLAIGHLRCGWQPASVALVGGLLVFLAMYVIVVPTTMSQETTQTSIPATAEAMAGMPTAAPNGDMSGMEQATPVSAPPLAMPGMLGRTNAPLFYVGVVLIISSFGLVWWRRWTKLCQPLNPLHELRSIVSVRRN